jgi:hypothetical protein
MDKRWCSSRARLTRICTHPTRSKWKNDRDLKSLPSDPRVITMVAKVLAAAAKTSQ